MFKQFSGHDDDDVELSGHFQSTSEAVRSSVSRGHQPPRKPPRLRRLQRLDQRTQERHVDLGHQVINFY